MTQLIIMNKIPIVRVDKISNLMPSTDYSICSGSFQSMHVTHHIYGSLKWIPTLKENFFFSMSKYHSSCHLILHPGNCYCQEIGFTETKQGGLLSSLKINTMLYSLPMQ